MLTDPPAVDGVHVPAPVVLAAQHACQGLPQAALQQGDLLCCWLCSTQHPSRQEWPLVLRALQLGSSIDLDELHPQVLSPGGQIAWQEEENKELILRLAQLIQSGFLVPIPLLLLKQDLRIHQDGSLSAGIEMQIATYVQKGQHCPSTG